MKILLLFLIVLLNACSEKSPFGTSQMFYRNFTGNYSDDSIASGIIYQNNHIFKDSVYIHQQFRTNPNYPLMGDRLISTSITYNITVNIPEQTMKIYNEIDTTFFNIKKFDNELLLEGMNNRGNSVTIKGVKYQ